jgi:tripartite-type tricarboxylate transporter receptor subunit TctC
VKTLLVFFISALAPAALAQTDFPNRPIRLLVTVPPGGPADFIARLVGERVSKTLGQPAIVENRGGASGMIAAEAVAKAAPDGHTLLQNSVSTHGIGPHLHTKLAYDPVKDFSPVSMLAFLPVVMAVNSALPVNGIEDVVALSRRRDLHFASSGIGGGPHMAAELFMSVTGARLVHVPYNGTGPALADLVDGRVQIMFGGIPPLLAHMRSGRLRVLAAASRQRHSLLADVPTFAELGYAQVVVSLWYGVLAPAGTPGLVVARLNTEIGRALLSPDVRERLIENGAEPASGTPEAFGAFMRDESVKWAQVVKRTGMNQGPQ